MAAGLRARQGAVPVLQPDRFMHHPARLDRDASLPLKSDQASARLAVKHLFTGVNVPVRVTPGRVVEPVHPQGVLGRTKEKWCSHHPRRDLHDAPLDHYRSFSKQYSPRMTLPQN